MYVKTLDARLTFSSFAARLDSTCRVRAYEPECPCAGLPTVAVVSQEPGSPGSVTNFAEDLAGEVLPMLRARRRLEPGDPHRRVIWVQHYPTRNLSAHSEERFSLVRFAERPDGRFGDPQWLPVSRGHIEEAILGRPLGD